MTGGERIRMNRAEAENAVLKDQLTALEELEKKWREAAGSYMDVGAKALRHCADELDTALSTTRSADMEVQS